MLESIGDAASRVRVLTALLVVVVVFSIVRINQLGKSLERSAAPPVMASAISSESHGAEAFALTSLNETENDGESMSSKFQEPVIHIAFWGTSYARAIYFSLFEMLSERKMTEEEKFIPSYENQKERGCNLNNHGTGRAGVDSEMCGWPGFKSVRIGRFRLTFQFKTYLYTPEADAVAVQNLNGLEDPIDVLVLGSAEWGKNPFLPHMDYAEQVRRFYIESFKEVKARMHRVFVYDYGFNRSTKHMWDLYSTLDDMVIFNMKEIIHKARSESQEMSHGFFGWPTQVIANFTLACAEQGPCDNDQNK